MIVTSTHQIDLCRGPSLVPTEVGHCRWVCSVPRSLLVKWRCGGRVCLIELGTKHNELHSRMFNRLDGTIADVLLAKRIRQCDGAVLPVPLAIDVS